ncbi:MAG: inositol monophosphatase family protein [Planctomycetota bacterium]
MLDFAIYIARKAGEVLLAHFGKLSDSEIAYKGKRNPVTAADTESEELIVSSIVKKYPNHSILTEERPHLKKDSEYEWIIDPLDGTVNFMHNTPVFCVSIALLRNNIPEVGVVFAPMLNELFTAVKGQCFVQWKKNKGITDRGFN